MSAIHEILIVDDDATFRGVLADSLKARNIIVYEAENFSSAINVSKKKLINFAIVDLKMPGDSGLVLIKELRALNSKMNIVMLTGFASIATAVEAVKLGANQYLAKPVNAEEILEAFSKLNGNEDLDIQSEPLTVDKLEWEHINRILNENNGNISATARALNMHRRTLQRKLQRKPIREPRI
jgi:two-component system, response regulator RegA